MSGWASRIARKPARTSAWSSAMRTEISLPSSAGAAGALRHSGGPYCAARAAASSRGGTAASPRGGDDTARPPVASAAWTDAGATGHRPRPVRRDRAYGLPPMLDPSVNDPAATPPGRSCCRCCSPDPVAAPVSLRCRRIFAVGCVVSGIPTFDQFRLVVAIPVAVMVLYSLGTRRARTRARGGRLVLAGLTFVGATESVLPGSAGCGHAGFLVPFCLAVWGAGRSSAAREDTARLTERSAQLRRQREATAALAVEIDRERLASDLDLAARSRLQETIALASGGAPPTRGGRGSPGSNCWVASHSTRCAACSASCARRPRREGAPALARAARRLLADARAGGRTSISSRRRAPAAATVVELAAYRTLQHALAAIGSGRDEPAWSGSATSATGSSSRFAGGSRR